MIECVSVGGREHQFIWTKDVRIKHHSRNSVVKCILPLNLFLHLNVFARRLSHSMFWVSLSHSLPPSVGLSPLFESYVVAWTFYNCLQMLARWFHSQMAMSRAQRLHSNTTDAVATLCVVVYHSVKFILLHTPADFFSHSFRAIFIYRQTRRNQQLYRFFLFFLFSLKRYQCQKW